MVEGLVQGVTQLFQKKVTMEDTALNFGSGAHTNLLATPSLVAFMIECTINMVDTKLPKGYVTVGKSLSVSHEAPTAKGTIVTIQSKLLSITGNHLVFEITAFDELGVVATGTHERYIVNYDRFMDHVEARCRILTDEVLRVEV